MVDVIIVEDDPMVCRINRQYLDQFPQLMVTGVFRNGRDALQHLRQQEPTLVILDVYMPMMTGLELLAKMRNENIKSDVIMVTAANEVEKVDEALKLGIVDYLIKPFEYKRFCEAIEKFLTKSNLLKERNIVNQEIVDRLVSPRRESPGESIEIRKGINPNTLLYIKKYIETVPQQHHTCESISALVGLSKVTVRRYLNYLIECGEMSSDIDYETGGRPSVRYRLN